MAQILDFFGPAFKAGLSWIGKGRLPQIDGPLSAPGLHEPVEILRDRSGVPHIYAQNEHDLFFAQGFVHAQDRLWQMELNRRTANGTLSELIGELALDTDRASRTFGFARLGRQDWQSLETGVREAIQSYVEGINAALQTGAARLPVEMTLLGQKPRPWTVDDCLALSHLMVWQMSHAWYFEITHAKLVEAVGPEHAAELDINYPAGNPCSLADGIEFNALGMDGALQAAQGPFLQRGMGSNGWAISGQRSVTGQAYLCNDMHLVLTMPVIWYANHLSCPKMNVTGVSIPGLPLVLGGHNDRIAWGMTLAYIDCEDLFIEKFDEQDPLRYRFQEEWQQAEVIEESIPIKGKAQPFIEKVLVTRHGPVISDAVKHPGQRLAVNSMSLRPCTAMDGWYLLDAAAGWDDFVSAMQKISAPQLSVVYADTDSNIGYWITGKTPIRAKGDGSLPAPGWTGEYEWIGEIPFEEMPHALNPRKGFVVNCNNKIIPDDYPHFLGNIWMTGYRARRLTEMIESKEKLSPDDFIAMQTDVTCIPGLQLVEHLRSLSSQDADARLALDYLCGWDGRLPSDTVAGAIYEVARYQMVRNIVEPVLGTALTNEFLGLAFNPVLLPDHEYYGNDTPNLLRMLANPDSWWLAQAGGKEKVLEDGLKQAVHWLREKLGPDPRAWQWGRLHRITFAHAMAMQKPLDQVFNRGPYPVGGDTDTPWQAAMMPGDPYDNQLWAPSIRHIFDMGDLSRSVFVLPTGQSGQLGSAHYDDMVPLWLKGQYRPMWWTRQQVEQDLEGKLTLQP